jgi:hypothetical protein
MILGEGACLLFEIRKENALALLLNWLKYTFISAEATFKKNQ